MRSMTGYGRGAANAEGRSLLLELKSVNHRFLDLNFRMPRSFAALEDALRSEISARVHRGHIDVFVTYRNERQDRCTVVADTGLAKEYLAALEHLAQETGACGEVRLLDLARFADVLRVEEAEEDGSALRALGRTSRAGWTTSPRWWTAWPCARRRWRRTIASACKRPWRTRLPAGRSTLRA